MLSRRVLRIKAFQALYAYRSNKDNNSMMGEKLIQKSLQNIAHSYYYILILPAVIKSYVENEGNPNEFKYLPTKEDIASGNTFIYNKVIERLEKSENLEDYTLKIPFKWHLHKDFLRKIYYDFKTSEYFQAYIKNEEKSFELEKALLRNFFKEFLFKMEDFDQHMEEQNLYWMEDKTFIMSYVYKSIEKINENDENEFLADLNKEVEEAQEFSTELYRLTLEHEKENFKLITDKTKKWDADRIAYSDLLLMEMGLCEMKFFPEIPVKVSINEYIEIAKIYSTPKSNLFINGVLDKLMVELKEKGEIVKLGRGLVEN